MAKNSKGQTVSNKKYYKKTTDEKKKSTSTKKTATKATTKKNTKTTVKKTTTKKTSPKKTTPKKTSVKKSTVKKTTPKKTTVKKTTPKKTTTVKKKTSVKKVTPKKTEVVEKQVLDNNVSLIVDDKEEKLNYNIIDEDVKKKAKSDRKIKTKFNDDLLDSLESETIVNEAFSEEENKSEEEIEILSSIEEDKDKGSVEEHIDEEIAYNGFIIRLIVLVLILILSIFFVIKFCVKYINNSPMKDVSYFESSDVSYKLCTGNDCNEDTIVSNTINKANVKFNYNVSFDDTVSVTGKYKVIEKINISSSSAIVYNKSKDSLRKIYSEKKTKDLDINSEVSVDIGDYRKELDKYNKDHNTMYDGYVVVSLFVDGINEEKEVANISIPLSENKVQTSIISSNVGDSLFKDDSMQNYSDVYVILFGVSLIVVIAACIGIVVLINSSDIRGGEE